MVLNPKQLLVEATDDLAAVVGLMQHHVDWPNDRRPVDITPAGSADQVLKRIDLSARIKQSGLLALGIIVDADQDIAGRWQRVRDIMKDLAFLDVPESLPAGGVIVKNVDGLKFGAWIMPNNIDSGMLETFCAHLVPADRKDLWAYAREAVSEARKKGSDWREVHQDKVEMHTWLAWRDPPGERIGIALTKKLLDPKAASAAPFVKWFRDLFEV